MSQIPGTQDAAVHLNPHGVVGYFQAMHARDQSYLENIKTCKDNVLEAAQLYKDENEGAKLKKLREQLLSLVDTQQQVDAHQKALAQLQLTYRPTMEKTGFADLMQQHMQDVPTLAHPEHDDDVAEFDSIAGLDAAAEAAEDDLNSDEELLILGGAVEKNEKCPYTMKPLIDLQEPVEDHRGFVYENAAITEQLRRYQRIECPIAGASHFITLQDLKPCRRIIRQQKTRAKHGQSTQHGQQAQHPAAGNAERVLDV